MDFMDIDIFRYDDEMIFIKLYFDRNMNNIDLVQSTCQNVSFVIVNSTRSQNH